MDNVFSQEKDTYNFVIANECIGEHNDPVVECFTI